MVGGTTLKIRRALKLLALLGDEVIVGIFLVLILPATGIGVPFTITLAILGLLFLKDILIAPYVLSGGLEKKPETGPESLIGGTALVVEDLSPEGVVKIGGELWRAECLNGVAERGESVRIISVRGTKVLVKRRDFKD